MRIRQTFLGDQELNVARAFPRTCVQCGHKSVYPSSVHRNLSVRHDGTAHDISISNFPVETCGHCGTTTSGVEADDAINNALREHLGFLQSEQILQARTNLDLTQEQLAKMLGCAKESISRWENDAAVQTRMVDRFLRVFFAVPAARTFLHALTNHPFASFSIITDLPHSNTEWQTSPHADTFRGYPRLVSVDEPAVAA